MKKLALVFVLLCCCNAPPGVAKPTTQCEAACSNLKKHNCVDGRPVKLDTSCDKCQPREYCNVTTHKCEVTCEVFCEDTTSSGIDMNLDCVAHAKTCSTAKKCNTQ